jgi:tRNA pseudouridine55 synthase
LRPDTQPGPDGVLVVDKPRGITSHDVVTRCRRILGTRRVGHVGTLDPLATGVLPLVIGRSTRLATLLSDGDKVYQSVFRLGVVTNTYDITGTVVADAIIGQRDGPAITREAVELMSRRFVGSFTQAPPPFSAKKIGGVRAYRLARRQEPVEPKPVEVTVHQLDIQSLTGDRLSCRVVCAPGFYVRSLAHDLGQALGCGACLEELRREQSGAFGLGEAATMDQLERDHESMTRHLLPMAELLPNLPSVVVTGRGAQLAAHGNSLTPPQFEPSSDAVSRGLDHPGSKETVKVYNQEGALLAIAEGSMAGVLHPRIVLV